MKLIVDEFIEHILTYPGPVGQGGPVQRGMTKRLMDCLSAFTSQTRDVNVSLTSIEVAALRCLSLSLSLCAPPLLDATAS